MSQATGGSLTEAKKARAVTTESTDNVLRAVVARPAYKNLVVSQALRRQRQADLCGFEASLIYKS